MSLVEALPVEEEIWIDAPPDRVWPLVADPAVHARYSPELAKANWCDGATGPTLGARIYGLNGDPEVGEWESISQVVECAPGRSFAWAVGELNNPAASWRFDLVPERGGTRLRQSARFGGGPSGVADQIKANPQREAEFIATRRQQWHEGMRAVLAGIKELAEP